MMKVVDKMLDWENGGRMDLLKSNYPLPAPQILFRKIEDEEIVAQITKLNAGLVASAAATEAGNKANNEKKPIKMTLPSAPKAAPASPSEIQNQKSAIAFDDFAKIDLRIGTILTAEKVEKADKLLKLSVDMGTEQRTIVSGIAQHFSPEEIIGKQVTVVANLAPRKMRGIESQGMILMAEGADGKLIFVAPVKETAAGSEVR